MVRKFHSVCGLFAALAIVAAACSPTLAAGIVFDSEGFEPPTYSLGDLEGQSEWLAQVGNTGTAVVQDTTVKSGTQAVKVDRTGTDDRYGVPTGFVYPPQRFICISWDMLVNQTISTDFGPFFGVEAFNFDELARVASYGVDATTGDVLYEDSVLGLQETGSSVMFDEWNNFQVNLDFLKRSYSVELNGSTLGSWDFASNTGGLTDVDISALAASATGQDLTGTAYFDNFLVQIKEIPEPSSVVLLLFGTAVVGATGWRRSRAGLK